uniref:Uncharacterized protein n=1 Tax=Rhizophora mucronata TaxID=61149 RepID=A0A2P2PXF2_RHIMU
MTQPCISKDWNNFMNDSTSTNNRFH